MITIVANPKLRLKQPVQRRQLDEMRRRAMDVASRRTRDLTAYAQTRANGELERGRTLAASKLEALAQTLRPQRKLARGKLNVGPRSTLVIAATLGVGVAVGLAVNNQLKKRRAARAEQPRLHDELPPLHEAQAHEPVGAVP